jgi:nitric oxide reductase subunit B
VRRLWTAFAAVTLISFAKKVITAGGKVLIAPGEIGKGQNVWQSLGGMQVGSVWGHGSYVAPDWTADWLHREAMHVLDVWARAEAGKEYAALDAETQAKLRGRLEQIYRENAYDSATGTLRVADVRGEAFEANRKHYASVFMDGTRLTPSRRARCGTRRAHAAFGGLLLLDGLGGGGQPPGHDTISYTHNWPHEPLVGNRPTGESVMWTGVSIIMLLAGICAMVWWYAAQKEEPPLEPPASDPLGAWQADALAARHPEVLLGGGGRCFCADSDGSVTAHYGVEGHGFYGIPLAEWLPYSVSRTWHVQPAFLDRHGLAGGGIVHRPAGERASRRAEGGRQLAVRRAASGGRRLAHRPVAERPQQAGSDASLLLLGPSGL